MKNYPTYIIDRSRRSDASHFTDDFIVCTDKEVGFIARVIKQPKSKRTEFESMIARIPKEQSDLTYATAYIRNDVMIVLHVERFLYEPLTHPNRVKPLLKKRFESLYFRRGTTSN